MGKSKRMKELKQKMESNSKISKEKSIYREKKIESNKVVLVDLKENLVAKVDRGNYFVSTDEIKELVADLFHTNVELKENSIIDLDSICDVYYRLKYDGAIKDEILFSLC